MQQILDSLKFDVTVFLIQVGLFVIVLAAMNVLFWKPILAHLAARDQDIKDAYRAVERTRSDMEQLRTDYQTRIGQVEADARARIQSAIKEAQSERERMLTEVRSQSEELLRKSVSAMEREREEALESLRPRVVELAVSAVQKALGAFADTGALRQAVESSVARNGRDTPAARN